ncbi:methyltransferase domain-containing protein [Pseudoxanthomonas winnipegensis]|uniref:Methyltransferase domain-containing protein n=2 Tax=Pseudoxanthomonas winnipegensis TaxID=2480810 RepID=A0A4Q8LPC2_9GAMM|nr:methyltransferase domain-containing protein [Pseudoxanthomonas winnipegensis]TAA33089.1 methyltransferase domain-containing protein [Pseudoxanthomonas winnipegensis]TBV78427.1 methyltransferase domain-containing protein [Pseudoxanthomonas winnipegensis]
MLIDPRAVMQELQLPMLARDGEGDMSRRAAVPFDPKDAYKLSELLAYSGEEFVEIAYQAVLKRLPDDSGRQAYLKAMEIGSLSKIEVLGELRKSPEGLNAGVVIHDLRMRYFLRRMRRKRGGRVLDFILSVLRVGELSRRIESVEVQLAARGDRTERRVAAVVDDLRKELRQQISASAYTLRKSVGRTEGEVTRRMQELATRIEHIDAGFESRRAGILDEMVQRLARHSGFDSTAGATEDELSAMYVRLENAFRGSQEEIQRRGQVYLPYIAAAAAATGCRKTLDLGCGRGELLGMLGEHGYEARGIDLNPFFVDENRQAGREVTLGDALAALESCEPDSLAAITSIHLVEHVSVRTLVHLLDLALRALRPGGRLILETPNPQNLRTSAYYFYFDPTHRNPLPPPLLAWMVGDRGFVDVQVDLLQDGRFVPETGAVAADVPGADQINRFVDWLSASPDYAIVATKPLEAG